jgi:polyisoprenoid-binding protein YceI
MAQLASNRMKLVSVRAVGGRHMRRSLMVATAIAVAWSQPIGVVAGTQSYHVDSAKSSATIHVGKAGAFSFVAGHTHEVMGPIESGSVDVDVEAPSRSHVRLVIAAAELKVSAEGEPHGDAPKVQEAMHGDAVLDVAHHARITYESTSVTVQEHRGNRLDLVVAGQLTIRDTSQSVKVPVRVELADDTLTASGRFAIKQSAFGIKPISVGGVVAVKDTLDVEFSVSAKK